MSDHRKPSRYRKLPVEIEAWQWVSTSPPERDREARAIAAWCGGRFTVDAKPSDPTDIAYRIQIPTLEGVMEASPGDWIIRGVKGEFYPCKPDVFAATYDDDLREVPSGKGALVYGRPCHCPDGELDGDR